MKSYILYDENNNIKQFVRCKENEIELYESLYIEVELDDFHFDSNFTYKLIDNEIVVAERTDSEYLRLKTKNLQASLINNIEVEYNGVIYQGDETSQSRMSRAIAGLPDDTTTIKWRAKDNTSHELNRLDLKQILYLAGQEQTRILFLQS